MVESEPPSAMQAGNSHISTIPSVSDENELFCRRTLPDCAEAGLSVHTSCTLKAGTIGIDGMLSSMVRDKVLPGRQAKPSETDHLVVGSSCLVANPHRPQPDLLQGCSTSVALPETPIFKCMSCQRKFSDQEYDCGCFSATDISGANFPWQKSIQGNRSKG